MIYLWPVMHKLFGWNYVLEDNKYPRKVRYSPVNKAYIITWFGNRITFLEDYNRLQDNLKPLTTKTIKELL